MDEGTKELLAGLDDKIRLLEGEWTTDGRKLFLFEIAEIQVVNSCGLENEQNKIVSGLHYYLRGKGNPPANIFIFPGKERPESTHDRENIGIGTFFLYTDSDEKKEKAQIEIILDPPAFDNFIHSLTVFRFKGKMKFRVIVKKRLEETHGDVLEVVSYELENYLRLLPD